MVLMRTRESFEDLEKRYKTRQANTGTKNGIAAIMKRLIGNRNWRAGGRRGRRGHRVLNHPAEKVGGGESG